MTFADLTRRGRRRLFVIAVAGLVGLSVPRWVPRLLATLPAFRVEQISVLGTRYVAPDEIKRLIAVSPDASVWDDVERLADRVRAHPMIREATVRRDGLHGLSVTVVEKRPVALVATPELRPVNGDGRLLPLRPAEAALDLPIVQGVTDVEGSMVTDPGVRLLAGVLDALDRSDPDFVSVVSEASIDPDGAIHFRMLPTADAGEVLLPAGDPVEALRRVSLALGRVPDRRVDRADARFDRQVVLTGGDAR
jgi:hypothetical protein